MDIEELLISCILHTATEEEYQKALEWINQSPENLRYYEELRDAWIASALNKHVPEEKIALSLNRVKSRIGINDLMSAPNTIYLNIFKIAALIVVTFALGFIASGIFYKNKISQGNLAQFVIEAPRGAKSVVTMADGTKIWLNAGSQIKYDNGFNAKNRNIYLQGEAYFDVAKNKKIPFLVHSGDVVVKAVGTEFNVKAYPEEGKVVTTLVEGIVSIVKKNNADNKDAIILRPKQNASFVFSNTKSQASKQIKPVKADSVHSVKIDKNVETEIFTSWRDKRWVFRKEHLKDFAIKLERLYDVKIRFEDRALMDYKLTGTIEEESVEQVLNAIKLTIPLDYSIKHREITLRLNKQLNEKYFKLLKHIY